MEVELLDRNCVSSLRYVVNTIYPFINDINHILMPIEILIHVKKVYSEIIKTIYCLYGIQNVKIILAKYLFEVLSQMKAPESMFTGVSAWISMLTFDYDKAINLIMKCADEINSEIVDIMQKEYQILIPEQEYKEFMSPEKNIVVFSLVVNMIDHWNFIASHKMKDSKSPTIRQILTYLSEKKIVLISKDEAGIMELTLHPNTDIESNTPCTSLKFYSYILLSEVFKDK